MRSFWLDPYLWVHAAGLAAVPLCLELCLLGFAVGYPLLPPWLELLIVAGLGALPIAWMQWQRPFYIFSLLFVALQPTQLTEDQRRILRFFKTPQTRILSLLVPVVLLWILAQLYRIAPIATAVNPITTQWRIVGLLMAAIAFFAANLFTQVPFSVFRVLLVSESAFAATEPYPVEHIAQDFMLLGLRVNRLFPPLVLPSSSEQIATAAAAVGPSEAPLSITKDQIAEDQESSSTAAIETREPAIDASRGDQAPAEIVTVEPPTEDPANATTEALTTEEGEPQPTAPDAQSVDEALRETLSEPSQLDNRSASEIIPPEEQS